MKSYFRRLLKIITRNMNLSISTILLVLFCGTVSGEIDDNVQVKLTNLTRQLESVLHQLGDLSERTGRIEDKLGLVLQLAENGTAARSNCSTNGPKTGDGTQGIQNGTFVTLLSASRISLGTDARYTLRLRKSVDGNLEYAVRYSHEMPSKDVESVTEESDGVIAVSVVIKDVANVHLGPWLMVATQDMRQTIAVELNTTANNYGSQRFGQLPHIKSADEVVYTFGNDANFSMNVDFGDFNSKQVNLYNDLRCVDLENNTFSYANLGDLVSVSGEKDLKNITIDTSHHPISGYLSARVGIKLHGSVVTSIQSVKDIVVRPTTQPGPFPNGYLSIAVIPGLDNVENGEHIRYCFLGEPCHQSCIAVGDNVTDVIVMGKNGIVPEHTIDYMRNNEMMIVHWEVYLTGPLDVQQFRCNAIGANGHVYTNVFTVKQMQEITAYFFAQIDTERTNFLTDLYHDDEGDMVVVSLTCGVTHDPSADHDNNITVQFDWPAAGVVEAPAEYVDIVDSGSFNAMKQVPFPREEYDSLIDRTRIGEVQPPRCTLVDHLVGMETASYTYDWPN